MRRATPAATGMTEGSEVTEGGRGFATGQEVKGQHRCGTGFGGKMCIGQNLALGYVELNSEGSFLLAFLVSQVEIFMRVLVVIAS